MRAAELLPPTARAAVTVLTGVWRHPANRGRRVRKLAETVRFQWQTRRTGRPYRATIGDRSVLWARHGAPSARAVYANPPDWPEMAVWTQHLRRGSLFVDVGANVGLYTLLALDVGAEVVAVEPNAAARAELEENLALNGYTAEIVAAAVADRPGQLELAGPDLPRQRLVLGGDPASGHGVVVPVTTLDDVLGERAAAGVKIDVEGAELFVLQGAAQALAQQRIGLLQLEWNECASANFGYDRHEVAALLESYGYATFRPDHSGRLRPDRDPLVGTDVFAMPAPIS